MDGTHFDRMVTRLAAASNRRGLLQFLVALAGFFPLLAVDEGRAGKGTGGRKGGKRHGRNRPRRRHTRRRHHHKKNKKKDRPQEQCSPQTPDGACATGQLCLDGACQPCTVTCGGDALECGAALQAAIDAAPSAPIVVCAGRYAGNFVIDAGVELIGAGDGDDTDADTILDAQGAGNTLTIASGGSGEVVLERLRITGGHARDPQDGGGIANSVGRTLTMTGCTVFGNIHDASGGSGGGIGNHGTLTLRDCRIENNSSSDSGGGIFSAGSTTLTGSTQVRGNTAISAGGGIFVESNSDLTIDAGCQVTANTAPAGEGGGIYSRGTVNLANDQIVTDNTGGNCFSEGPPIANCA